MDLRAYTRVVSIDNLNQGYSTQKGNGAACFLGKWAQNDRRFQVLRRIIGRQIKDTRRTRAINKMCLVTARGVAKIRFEGILNYIFVAMWSFIALFSYWFSKEVGWLKMLWTTERRNDEVISLCVIVVEKARKKGNSERSRRIVLVTDGETTGYVTACRNAILDEPFQQWEMPTSRVVRMHCCKWSLPWWWAVFRRAKQRVADRPC